jgi:hypothetical protein
MRSSRERRQRRSEVAVVTDFASEAAALTAGYKKQQIDRGAGKSERYITHLEKIVTGGGQSGSRMVATGTSGVSAAAADTQALTVLNAQRRARYGGSPGRTTGVDSDSPDSRGATHVIDTT